MTGISALGEVAIGEEPSPSSPNSLSSIDVVVGGISISQPTIGIVNNLISLSISVGSPSIAGGISGPPLMRSSGLGAFGLVVGSPVITLPMLNQISSVRLISIGIVVDRPFLGVPVGPVRDLAAVGLTVGAPTIDVPLLQVGDPINPDILVDAGSQLIWRQATGLEKAQADVDAYQLTRTYAELVRDQWDPYAINYRNLSYLAWAMGVNLWEEDWDETFRRWWVANQWTFKSQRGSLFGISNFLNAAGSNQQTCPYGINLISAIVPPAKFFPGKSSTPADRAQYLARFPQLRLYPYVSRELLPYNCFCSKFMLVTPSTSPTNPPTKLHNKNGNFLGPLRKFFPTNSGAGGRYTRTAVYWDRGASTNLTLRTIVDVDSAYGATTYDLVTVPARKNNHWFLDQKGKWPLPAGHNISQNVSSIFLGADDDTASRQVLIPRDGQLNLSTAQAQYQTINTGMTMIDVYPNNIAQQHSYSNNSLFCGAINKSSQYSYKFTQSISITTNSVVGSIEFTDSYPQIVFGGVWVTGDVINFTVVGISGSYTISNLNPTVASVALGISNAINDLGVIDFSNTTVSGSKILLLPMAPVKNKQYICKKFLPTSTAWQYLYEQWFIFDPSRVPDYRKASVYLGHARLGIQKYTAEIRVAAFSIQKKWYFKSNGFMRGHLKPADTFMIEKVRRAVTASMALRDTVRIDTKISRVISTNDSLPLDGSFTVGEFIDSSLSPGVTTVAIPTMQSLAMPMIAGSVIAAQGR